jgi:hypothetical protein
MPNEGKPENAPIQPTATPGSEAQPTEQKPANPTVEMSDSVKSYLKGLGLEGVQATPELVKVAEAGMKQKESVSRKSQEVETLLARLASQGKDTSEPEPITSSQEQTTTPQTTSTQFQQPTETTGQIGVSDNDLFDLARMVTTDFKELSESAQDGSLFRELRQLGYFTSKGIDKKAVYDYLAGKNAAAQELRELREFKQKYSQPNPNANPMYNATPGINMEGAMNHDMAHAIALQGPQSKRYQEAVAYLRKEVLDAK